jgi:hypothetical protein
MRFMECGGSLTLSLVEGPPLSVVERCQALSA